MSLSEYTVFFLCLSVCDMKMSLAHRIAAWIFIDQRFDVEAVSVWRSSVLFIDVYAIAFVYAMPSRERERERDEVDKMNVYIRIVRILLCIWHEHMLNDSIFFLVASSSLLFPSQSIYPASLLDTSCSALLQLCTTQWLRLLRSSLLAHQHQRSKSKCHQFASLIYLLPCRVYFLFHVLRIMIF